MNVTLSTYRRFLMAGFVVQTLALGGCPVDVAGGGGASPAPLPPGVYYVERLNDRTQAFDFPVFRGDPGQWLELATVPDGYTGDGNYRVNQRGEWSLISLAGHEALDELLVRWDPAPTPGTIVQ